MIVWSHQYADGSKLLAHVTDDGELCIEMVTAMGMVQFTTYLPRGSVEELKKFLTMKGF